MTAHILWARHGQNSANLTRTLSYRIFDGDLTDLGRQQAGMLAARLAGSTDDPVRQVVSSPLRRARQTAEIVAARLGLEVSAELDDLREVNVGVLDGRSDEQAWSCYTEVLRAWRTGTPEARFPGGEDHAELCGRLTRALLTVARRSGGSPSLIVAHGASLRAALPALAGVADPGADLRTGAFAELRVGTGDQHGPVIELTSWPA